MELNVGDYIRTENGLIGKIIDFKGDMVETDNKRLITYKSNHNEIINSSPNIIDLIEIGDYVNGRIVDEFIYLDKLGLIGLSELEKEDEKLIKSIVTKEMYASVEYRVETN